MAFRLFVDSSNGVSVEPDWGLAELDRKIEDEHRTRAGGRYVYKWGSYRRWKMPVSFVSSSDAAIVNSWWQSNTKLLFKSESAAAVYSVQITSNEKPFGKYVKPYDDLYEGTIELETY